MRSSRIETEKKVLRSMVRVYCRGHKHTSESPLCEECQSLVQYAWKRLDHCRFGEEKTFCERCPVHCYSPAMRTRVKQVMRYSGPRMLIYHPIIAIRHMLKLN